MPDIKYIEDKSGEVFYPVTHERAVRDSDGVAISTKVARNDAEITAIGGLVASLRSTVESMSPGEVIIAWDGDSTPDVSKIPAGVSVEYDGSTYTGTLAPSSSTAGKIYWVGEEGSTTKTQYITENANGTYSWLDGGTTAIDLSDYQRKDDEIWLTYEEFANLAVKDPTKTYNVYEEESMV